MKQCYYELLQIDRKATGAEIKTNYRKLALKFHPDKNPTEEGRQKFLLITQAYQVLSDPNQRTWYDNNRQKILFNKDEMSKQDLQQYSFGFNIWPYFTSACFKGFQDNQGGFYHVYRDVFQKIKAEESKAFGMREDLEQQQMRKYQGFGDSTTITKKVLQFYDDWENFTTYKSFMWVDEWDTRQAQNRWVKREMQKENKKQRQKEKKTYIKTIKDLTAFLKKRDPRYREYLLQQKKKEQQRQTLKKQKQQQKKKQKEEMKKVKQQLEQEKFKQIEQYYKKQQGLETSNNTNHQVYDDEDEEQFHCAICQKSFKSENQLRNHENSKMHKNNVKQLQKQVMSKQQKIQQVQKQLEKQQQIKEPEAKKSRKNRKKNKNKNDEKQKEEQSQDQSQKKIPQPQVKEVKKQTKGIEKVSKQEEKVQQKVKQQPKTNKNKKKNKNNKMKDEQSQQQQIKLPPPKKQEKKPANAKKQQQVKKKVASESDSDDHDAFMNLVNSKSKKPVIEVQQGKKPEGKGAGKQKNNVKKVQSESEQSGQDGQQKKKGKAKLKREKKANKQQDTSMKCNVCNETFPSKTKLFDHINKTGHAKAK